MSSENFNEGFAELYDLTKQQAVARAPLDQIKHMPRAGERIFLPLGSPRKWVPYTVMTVEYFLGHNEGSEESSVSVASGMVGVTLYVEPSE